MKFTLGTVPYLNALPLHAFLDGALDVEIVRAVPSLLAPMLQRGECDAALIPVVEHLRGVGERIISDAGVGANGPVRSVLLFYRAPLESLHSIAADGSSRTSVALLRVLLHERSIAPPFVEHAPDLPAMLQAHEAALLIGDPALEAAQSPPAGVQVLDLGAAWRELTGLPFIFAAWVTRRGLAAQREAELAQLLSEARDEALTRLPQLARETTLAPGVSAEVRESYLREAIQYRMTPPFRAGLAEFEGRARALKLI